MAHSSRSTPRGPGFCKPAYTAGGPSQARAGPDPVSPGAGVNRPDALQRAGS